LGVSSIIVLGESGGGNLAIASAIKANKEGWIDNIDGVYAMAPMIFGFYGTPPPNLMSWRENLDYMGSHAMMRAMRMVYDPNRENHENPLAYPFVAKENELRGLPPHIIVNYELDLIRDEGVAFAQRLRKSGVDATSMIINGSTHCNEIAMPDVMPELTRDRLMSIATFARGAVT
jgi:acetyl esterase/lipase